ncbi:MAG: hypothetical protein KJ645_11185, partial [Planctomycetes bacterium]|nr:hypothetical protein [Planctomycetota bacterium]
PIEGVPPIEFVVIHPGISLPTREVYKNLNLYLTDFKNDYSLVNALLKTDNETRINACLFNRLEQPALITEPALVAALQKGRDAGFGWLRITGSGSCFFQAFAYSQAKDGIPTDGNQGTLFTIDPHWECFLVQSSPPVHF